ncbi:MAG: nucleotidyltransferase domain-containing protein [Dehalococcoidales bacterium]|nr:nucleotidyltransferase domain-containing protein [Dehalococcoidales bacterium]
MKERLVKELGDKLDSIILYGSVARRDFGKESDIDLLLISEDKLLIEKAYEIGYKVDIKNNSVTSVLIYSPEEISKNIQLGSPFAKNVINEGKTIYDNGTWERLRRSLIKASR